MIMCAAHNHKPSLIPGTKPLRVIKMYAAGLNRLDIMERLKINSASLDVIEDKISNYYKLYTMEECAEAWKKEMADGRVS